VRATAPPVRPAVSFRSTASATCAFSLNEQLGHAPGWRLPSAGGRLSLHRPGGAGGGLRCAPSFTTMLAATRLLAPDLLADLSGTAAAPGGDGSPWSDPISKLGESHAGVFWSVDFG
jgi:hypothetical protein